MTRQFREGWSSYRPVSLHHLGRCLRRLTISMAWAEHGSVDLLGAPSEHERQRRASAGWPVARRGRAGVRPCRVEAPPPAVRPGTVRRSPLIERLARGDPASDRLGGRAAGYGKTTLLSQWAERNGQAFAWVSVDEAGQRSEGPAHLRRRSARRGPADRRAGVRRAGLPGELGARLGRPPAGDGVRVDDLTGRAGPGRRARAAQLRMPGRAVGAGRSCAGRLAAGAGGPGRAAAADRAAARRGPDPGDRPRRSVAHLRGGGSLLRNAEVALGEDEVAELHRRTEGWPAGLYLAALYLQGGRPAGERGGLLRRR